MDGPAIATVSGTIDSSTADRIRPAEFRTPSTLSILGGPLILAFGLLEVYVGFSIYSTYGALDVLWGGLMLVSGLRLRLNPKDPFRLGIIITVSACMSLFGLYTGSYFFSSLAQVQSIAFAGFLLGLASGVLTFNPSMLETKARTATPTTIETPIQEPRTITPRAAILFTGLSWLDWRPGTLLADVGGLAVVYGWGIGGGFSGTGEGGVGMLWGVLIISTGLMFRFRDDLKVVWAGMTLIFSTFALFSVLLLQTLPVLYYQSYLDSSLEAAIVLGGFISPIGAVLGFLARSTKVPSLESNSGSDGSIEQGSGRGPKVLTVPKTNATRPSYWGVFAGILIIISTQFQNSYGTSLFAIFDIAWGILAMLASFNAYIHPDRGYEWGTLVVIFCSLSLFGLYGNIYNGLYSLGFYMIIAGFVLGLAGGVKNMLWRPN